MLRKIWHDPVWSKVIAGVILTIVAAPAAYFLDWWPRIIQSLSAPPRFLRQRASVPNWLTALLVLLALPTVIVVARFALLTIRRNHGSVAGREGQADWRLYTTDDFYGLRWRWGYIGDGIPDSLATLCPHCDCQVYPHNASPFRAVDQIAYHCDSCNRDLPTFEESSISLHNKVERFIQERIRNGTWRVPNPV